MNKLSLLSLLFISSFVGAQSEVDRLLEKKDTTYENEFGLFPIQNFTHQETGGHHQNWAITQDKTGFIYTGNGKGVLEYDGVSWRLISSPGLHAVRAVVADEKNVKWIGADRELGYLEPDSLGFLQFKSLKHKIPRHIR